MKADDVVVSMAEYNLIHDVLSLSNRAVIVPRVERVQDQNICAEGMTELGQFKMIHAPEMKPGALSEVVRREIEALRRYEPSPPCPDPDSLPRIDAVVPGPAGGGRSLLVYNG